MNNNIDRRLNHKSNRKWPISFIVIFVLVMISQYGFGQKMLTKKEAIQKMLDRDLPTQMSKLATQSTRQLEKTSFNISNPEIIIESPTGEFYTLGVQQRLDFPSVYIHQKKIAKLQTQLTLIKEQWTESEAVYRANLIYQQAAYHQEVLQLMLSKDSVTTALSLIAERLFKSGTIDALVRSFAKNKAGTVHNEWQSAAADWQSSKQSLALLIGVANVNAVEKLNKIIDIVTSNTSNNSLANQYYAQQHLIDNAQVKLDKSKALPGILVGYQNQGIADTPLKYRWQLGLSIPLWYQQYNARTKSSQYVAQASALNIDNQSKKRSIKLAELNTQLDNMAKQIEYFETEGLPNVSELINNSQRFFDVGKSSVTDHLRNVLENYETKLHYLNAIYQYNTTLLTYTFESN